MDSNELKEQEFLKARLAETKTKVQDTIDIIVAKGHTLTDEDKGFLRARVGYLTQVQKEEYVQELASNTVISADKTLDLYTRKELEAELQKLGVKDTSNKAYRTNADLIAGIKELKA